jgi:hypothetical protein
MKSKLPSLLALGLVLLCLTGCSGEEPHHQYHICKEQHLVGLSASGRDRFLQPKWRTGDLVAAAKEAAQGLIGESNYGI